MSNAAYKICPRCQQAAALDVPQCGQCGRVYKTQFNAPPAAPVVSPPPVIAKVDNAPGRDPLFYPKAFLCIAIGLFLFFVMFHAVSPSAHKAQENADAPTMPAQDSPDSSPAPVSIGGGEQTSELQQEIEMENYRNSSSSSGDRSVSVSGYTRKDGTYVAPYTRAAPGYGGGRRRR